MKICVYAIAKNEAKHVERFCKSAAGADYIVIADTGSEDDTVALAKDCGAIVHEISVNPFRFDVARNAALALVPGDVDVCVSLDLDEVLNDGWREEIERVWTSGVTRLRHRFDFSQGHIYEAQRVHARYGYVWKYPCHEFQVTDGRIREVCADTDMILMSHLKDETKSRGQYLDLLEAALREDPNCRRSQYYYARELYYYNRWQDSITGFERYLSMPDATWPAERCFARRTIAWCYEGLGQELNAEKSYLHAIIEYPETRDPWFALARFYYRRERWAECYSAVTRALSIETRNYDYTALPECWGSEPHDLAALAAYNLGMKDQAVLHGQEALYFSPDNKRLLDNLKWYLGKNEAAA